jgi:hypothetical protein
MTSADSRTAISMAVATYPAMKTPVRSGVFRSRLRLPLSRSSTSADARFENAAPMTPMTMIPAT